MNETSKVVFAIGGIFALVWAVIAGIGLWITGDANALVGGLIGIAFATPILAALNAS